MQKIVHGEAAQPLWEVMYRKCYPEGLVLGGPTGGHRQALCAELSTWRALASSLDPPTLQQMANVVGRSANAHSYYKHLNIGRVWPFHFRISAVAGMRAERRDGRTYYVDYFRGDPMMAGILKIVRYSVGEMRPMAATALPALDWFSGRPACPRRPHCPRCPTHNTHTHTHNTHTHTRSSPFFTMGNPPSHNSKLTRLSN